MQKNLAPPDTFRVHSDAVTVGHTCHTDHVVAVSSLCCPAKPRGGRIGAENTHTFSLDDAFSPLNVISFLTCFLRNLSLIGLR